MAPIDTPSGDPFVVDEITLDGKNIQVRSLDLPVDEVKLDPRNPRIANTVAIGVTETGPALQKKLEALLWDDDDDRDLYRQVLINKGLVERIIVRTDRTVVEGNCRTVVYRKLREKFPDEQRWKRIPARILPDDIGDRDVAILLGEMHVAGKNTWTPFEKAGHVYGLSKDFALTQEEIAQRLRMSKSKVNQLIRAFEVMKNNFLPKFPGAASIRKFSYFEELYKNPTLREWAISGEGNEDQFVDLVGTNKLSQGMHVRQLPAIFENPDAFLALKQEGFEAAKRALADDNPAVTSKLFKRMIDMTDALKTAQLDDIQRVRKDDKSKAREIVQELEEALGGFLELCELTKR